VTRRLVIVGGGIAGLAAAWEASASSGVSVTVLDDGVPAPGGKLRTSPLAGLPTDEGADMFLARVPEALALVDELGLTDRLTAPAAGGAAIWLDGAAHPMPAGLVLGVPTDPAALQGSPLVETADVEQVRAELGRVGAPVAKDRSVGSLIRERFGDRIADRLVQPLLGGINAGVLDRLSLAAVAPQLDRVARAGPSLAAGLAEDLAASRQAAAVAPPFYGLPGGMGELVATLRAQLTARGVMLRDGVRARSVRSAGGRLAIDVESTASGDPREVTADAVILAVPAAAAAALLRGGAGPARPTAPGAVLLLDELRTASVAMVRLAVRPDRVTTPPGRSGLLVPHGSGFITVAISYASTKWAHLTTDGLVRLRVSVGHDGDPDSFRLPTDELVARVLGDARTLTGLDGPVEDCSVIRWPGAFPQYDVGHLERCDTLDATLADELPNVTLTGAAYRGIGVPGCIRQGRAAAAAAVSG
jgi:oxygen-dependent protoporphyrinogen oxidase